MYTRGIEKLKGTAVSKLMGHYFCDLEGELGHPSTLVFPTENENWCRISPNWAGKIKEDLRILDDLFYDADIGYALIAPLIVMFGRELDGSEIIVATELIEGEEKTIIRLILDNKKSINLRFEDDEMYINLV